MYTPDARGRTFRARLLRWYARHRRDLPWRRTRDPYAILVSEVMLQQTQAERVVPRYARFLRRFPSLRALARSPLAEVLVEWDGLGYPRRARDLHRAARAVRRLPHEPDGLDALPGVGRYTAGAVACFAFGDPVAFADTNIRRVLGRVLLGRTATEREATALDAALLPRAAAARWHHALMDLGATVCTARAPRCDACPVRGLCLAKGHEPEPPRRRRATPFASSDRRVRGLILRALRDAPAGLPVAALSRVVSDERVARLASDLEREGLVESADGRARLPR